MATHPVPTGSETRQQKFHKVLNREPFKGLKAILDRLSQDSEAQCEAVHAAATYEDLLSKLGYRIIWTKQIHVQDAYTHLGPDGGIKAVLPYHDVPTQSSLPTLVHFDATVTTTPKSGAFFNQMLSTIKTQLNAPA